VAQHASVLPIHDDRSPPLRIARLSGQ
jgi:hypothetical protein